MTNEIKEILDIFKQVDLETDVGGCNNCPRKKDKNKTCIGCLNNAKDQLLDYITNLQEENERLKTTQIFIDTQDPEERCGQALYEEMLKRDCENYKQRIDKAIEYIEKMCLCKNGYVLCGDDLTPSYIVKILRGEDEVIK